MSEKGSVNAWIAIGLLVVLGGGIAYYVVTQQPNISLLPATGNTETVTGVYTYAATQTDFPRELFQLVGSDRVIGANYVRVRNNSAAVYALLGASTGTALPDGCYLAVRATIEVANSKLDTSSYAYLSPLPTVAVVDLVRVVTHGTPQQVCSPNSQLQ